jgi:hypothetical protein
MTNALRTVGALALLAALCQPLSAQVTGDWSLCNQDSLATWNCARYYTGTVTRKSELKGQNFRETWSITATVTAGRVTCSVVKDEDPAFEAPGMLVVAQEGTTGSGGYGIQVWCPSEAGERVGRSDSPTIEIMDKTAKSYATLVGTESYEHPDADSVNGVSGTVAVTWDLRRA